ncbi:helix-turn-helix domain-containing protein [Natronoglycomyces albus]|uniref:Helix-turn-helix domain-containing protein n=1 Tax=Natronoglycomyces albus TaxID=2811108 RepID=A0A895XNY8_9ACTN|nr:helix-turn-helix transcriptional regulator [Natronoglycomyces albus]QSB05099.1 helix-turn-helix domain-containing protein [Natronoglycomyces albus]
MKRTGPEPSLRAQWLGEKLRDLRKRLRIPQGEASKHIRRNPGMLSRYENGEIPFRREDVLALLDFYGVSNEIERNGLLQLCDDIWRKGWWDQHRDDMGSEFINVPWLEARTDRINTYQHLLVPGLLQTREYADAIIRNEAPKRTPEDQISRWVDVRVERQKVLHRESPVQLSVVLEEVALLRPVATSGIMADQLQHLLDRSLESHIEVLVMPMSGGPHKAQSGSFELFEMPFPYMDVTYIDTVGGSLYIEEPQVRHIQAVWDSVRGRALTEEDSRALIKRHMEGYQ